MSTMYPSLPSLPLNDKGNWPQAYIERHVNVRDFCPICKAEWISSHCLTELLSSRYEDVHGPPPPFPHKRYACGGIYRDTGDGYWRGQCLAPKTRQLELTLTEDEA
jgi:hypothetical protein